jgi:hypothetical protein
MKEKELTMITTLQICFHKLYAVTLTLSPSEFGFLSDFKSITTIRTLISFGVACWLTSVNNIQIFSLGIARW